MYKVLLEELWVFGQFVFRGNCIVMLESFWKNIIVFVYEGYQGMICIKVCFREKVWWFNMDKQVENFVKFCYFCQLVGFRSKIEFIRLIILFEVLWGDIVVDLLEIFGGNYLFVVVDNYLCWFEVILLKKIDVLYVIRVMEGIF